MILVVDDEAGYRELLAKMLTKVGYRVITAADGNEALTLLADSKFNLIISDVFMPNLNGYALAARIRATGPGRANNLNFRLFFTGEPEKSAGRFHRVYCKAPGFRVDNCNRSTGNVVGWEKAGLSIGLRSNILTSPRSVLIELVIELYRRRKDSRDSVWHFNTQCPDWPEVNYIQSRFLESEEREQICPECKSRS